MNENTITITKREYFILRIDSEILSRLEDCGVDIWDWYDESLTSEGQESFDDFEDNLKKELGLEGKTK